jgi:uncharacterized delta-60 repeat protein
MTGRKEGTSMPITGTHHRTWREAWSIALCVPVLIIAGLSHLALAAPGALDSNFGSGGIVTTSFGPTSAFGTSVVIQPNGKIVVAGSKYNNNGQIVFALARYNPNGSLDTSFNSTGKVTTPIGSGGADAYSVAIQDRKIVVAGEDNNIGGGITHFALARYNPNGSLDSSFNGTGKVTTQIGGGAGARSATIDPNGKIIAAGYSFNGNISRFALARYKPNGSLDTSFNSTGKVTTPIGSDAIANSVAIQGNGKIVGAGRWLNGNDYDFALTRYNPNGSLDTSFNSTGKVTTPIGSGSDDHADSVAIQANGMIVAAGLTFNGTFDDFALARYNANGSLDTTFDTDGKVTTTIGSDAVANSVAIPANGKIVAAGYAFVGGRYQFALSRYDS